MRPYLLSIGIMTGNSIDGIDLVLTYFNQDGVIRDLCSHHLPFNKSMYTAIRALQKTVAHEKGNMDEVVLSFKTFYNNQTINFETLHDQYISIIAKAVQQLIEKAKKNKALHLEFDLDQIDVIGFHGQTCDHCPPSRVGGKYNDKIYTIQIGNGQQLANLTGITVIYDFRSDDLMSGGEAAPLAPIHNQHLAETAKKMGKFPLMFCNAGNTGNITLITVCKENKNPITLGWDAGPFNHYPDQLMRANKNESCDWGGSLGAKGKINIELLEALFNHSVKMESGNNYLLQKPPKSGDPNYYQNLPLLDHNSIAFEDKLRTCEYFSAYVFFHSLNFIPSDLQFPTNFALFGGGWNNPITLQHFKGLLSGNWDDNPVLEEHNLVFQTILERLHSKGVEIVVEPSNSFGFDGTVMEARIFADMAKCRITGEPFSTPSTTGVNKSCVGGLIRYPHGNPNKATSNCNDWLQFYNSKHLTIDHPTKFDSRWSRASAGWHDQLKK